MVDEMAVRTGANLREVIDSHASLLFRCIEPSLELMIHLKSVAYLEQRGFSPQAQETTDVKIWTLLDMLQKVPYEECETVKNGVIAKLRTSGQNHVADVFCGSLDTVMSNDHYHTLLQNTTKLCQFLDPENGLLDELVSNEVIRITDAERIRSYSSYNDMARKLVEIIMRKSDSAFKALIEALDKTGQRHVTYILTGEGDSRPLSKEWTDKLLEKRSVVVQSIDSECLVSTLISKGVFTAHDKDRVEGGITNNKKGETMLDLIARKSEEAFKGFIETLQECECQKHVAVELVGPVVAATVKAQVTESVDADVAVETELLHQIQNAFQNNNTEVKPVNDLLASNGVAVIQVEKGSIIVKFQCRDQAAVASLKHLYSSKQLDQLFTEAFLPQFADKGLESLSLDIPDGTFERNNQLKLMTEDHRETLLSSAEWLGDKIGISGELLDKLSLCTRRRQAIERAATREEQVKTLLDIVSRQPDSAFTQLLSALDSTDQHEAVLYFRRWPRSSEHQDARE